jgi:hypothetical protein
MDSSWKKMKNSINFEIETFGRRQKKKRRKERK